MQGFVTIKIFARTEQRSGRAEHQGGFVTIKIFARTNLKYKKGSDTPPERAQGVLPPTFYCVNVNCPMKNINIL